MLLGLDLLVYDYMVCVCVCVCGYLLFVRVYACVWLVATLYSMVDIPRICTDQ